MYDFAHPIEDAIEGVTHSICTLEFEDHRPLYDWVVRELEYQYPPKQIEFAKLYLTNVVTGKRYIKRLVEEGIVDGWDDPRLVSIAALRRRGFTPESIKMFVELCGVSKANSSVDYAMLEYCIREDLKLKRSRVMAILDPVKLIIDNYPEGQIEELEAPNNMENETLGTRKVPFGKELYIEREDFMVEPPKKYKRLYPGNEVRLMNAYFVTCNSFVKDENGVVTEIHCTYDPASKGGNSPDGRKVKGTIQWVSAAQAVPAEKTVEKAIAEVKETYDFSNVEVEPLFKDMVDFDTFSKSDFRAVKVKECEAVPKSKKLLKFVLDDGSGVDRVILSGIHDYYEPEFLVGKTLLAITNLPPRKMMGIDSCGMIISATHLVEGREGLNVLILDDKIPAGAKLY